MSDRRHYKAADTLVVIFRLSSRQNVLTIKHYTIMFSLMSQVAASILLSASTFVNPIHSNALPFEASAYVTTNNHIRVAVQKSAEVPVVIFLRDKSHDILFRQNVSRKEASYVVKLDVNELSDGPYELEIKSSEGSIRKQLNVATAPVKKQTRVIAVM